MADRKSSFFSRLLSTNLPPPRRTPPPPQTTAAPRAAPTAEGPRAIASTTPPKDDSQSVDDAPTVIEPEITTPSRKATKSPSASRQSRSPPQPSSPSRPVPQPQSTPSSPSRTPSTPQWAPQLRSPSRLASRSPKQMSSSPSTNGNKPNSLSKESQPSNQEISNPEKAPTFASNKKNPVKDHDIEPHLKREESKEVKEILEATNIEANKHTKGEASDFLASKSASEAQTVEKAEIPRKPDEMQMKERGKRSSSSDTLEQSTLPSGKHVPLYKDINDGISTLRMALGDPKSTSNESNDRHISVITLAGENRGASMQMGSNTKREGQVHIRRGYKTNPEETTDGEENKSEEEAKQDQPTEACVNNNAQGINNSIVLNSSVSERDPGVHMVITHVPKEPVESTDRTRYVESRKAEFNMTTADKLTYEPTVRRRCLRGLFMEPSDSDGENPQKPRRHGCRVSCMEKGKENNADSL